jgi:hypothetical protein
MDVRYSQTTAAAQYIIQLAHSIRRDSSGGSAGLVQSQRHRRDLPEFWSFAYLTGAIGEGTYRVRSDLSKRDTPRSGSLFWGGHDRDRLRQRGSADKGFICRGLAMPMDSVASDEGEVRSIASWGFVL